MSLEAETHKQTTPIASSTTISTPSLQETTETHTNLVEDTDASETVEESGPVVYSDGEDEEGLRDADMEELAYEGDPLLYSDCEDEGLYRFSVLCC